MEHRVTQGAKEGVRGYGSGEEREQRQFSAVVHLLTNRKRHSSVLHLRVGCCAVRGRQDNPGASGTLDCHTVLRSRRNPLAKNAPSKERCSSYAGAVKASEVPQEKG
ncbi:unnamed protein product [Lota lota]